MIRSITLDRFRGFKHANLPLKPLTVLLGPNSAGKSSFLQAVAALHFVSRRGVSPATLAPTGFVASLWPFDFGTRQSLPKADSIERTVRITVSINRAHPSVASTAIAYEFGFGSASLELSRVCIEDQPRGVAESTTNLQTVVAPYAVTPAIGSVRGSTGELTNVDVKRVNPQSWAASQDEAAASVAVENLRVQITRATKSALASSVPGDSQVTVYAERSEGQDELLAALDGVRYLRASRVSSARLFSLRPEEIPADDVGPAGEWTGEVWLKMQPERVRLRRPPTSRQLSREDAARLVQAPRDAEESLDFRAAVDLWAVHLGIAHRTQAAKHGDAAIEVQVDVDGQHRSLADVGYGVSQVLPIIVQGLALPKGGTLLVEQPEAQLHPRPQAHLADFFCSLAEQGRNSIIETHSESFFRRLHLRALLDPALRELIAVYFVEPVEPEGCRQPILVPLEPDATVKWPKEFLAESVEAHASFAAVRWALAKRTA